MFKKFHHNLVELPKMERCTDEVTGKRYYLTPAGNRYTSVTTFTGLDEDKEKSLLAWRESIGEDKANAISKRASTRGTNLHNTLERYTLNEQITWAEISKDLLNKQLFLQIKKMLDDVDNIRVVEGMMYSDKLCLAGTADLVADYKKKLSVCDYKGSNRIKKEEHIDGYFIQGACYAIMYHELYDEMPEQVVIFMGVEDGAPNGLVFVKPIGECMKLLVDFMKKVNHYGSFR